ncbi:sensor histidine kinase [Floccifex sp.]|uniref:sensor histidine kinase n=1 Tax=Floccifex sp. TaxID=2815810 RepID=UPI002A754A82|nr:HAMP domain-containing sensor histidine kinase [Floccifex sp.]MDD7281083.1 HAMP domain-containing sensor histidine kinase [Erysipelotrichaceae bacterium]MDY2958355.1 HAMP domain-containing sensor histidine kinase [Floccifex sp.]
MKKKNIFSIVLYSFLIIASIIMVALFPTMNNVAKEKKNTNIPYDFEDDLVYFIVYEGMKLDEDYVPISFDESIQDPELMDSINRNFMAEAKDYHDYIKDDVSFYYSIKNVKTNQTDAHLDKNITGDIDQSNLLFSRTKSEDGWEISGNANEYYSSIYDLFDETMNNFLSSHDYTDDYESYLDANAIDLYSSVSLNFPENLAIHIEIPSQINVNSVFYNYDMYFRERIYFSFVAILYTIFTIILALIILLFPMKYLNEMLPFKMVDRIHFEFLFIGLCVMIPIMIAGTLYLSCFTASGALLKLFDSYHIPGVNYLLLIGNGICFFITLSLITIALYIAKELLFHPVQYFKEKTFICQIAKWINRNMSALLHGDLKSNYSIKLLGAVLINLICTCIFLMLDEFGVFLAVIFNALLFYFGFKTLKQIQTDYNILLESTEKLKNGKFDQKLDQDVHMFNSLKDSFNGIYDGFELAVQEEAKSQNMKVELISNVSHDLKTPLTCIKNYIVLLQDDNLDEKTRKEYLNNLNKYCNRMNILMTDLMQLSKINSGNIELEMTNLNIVSLLNQVIFENEEAFNEKQLIVKKNFGDEEIMLYLDSNKTYRLFENLLINISKYSLPGSRVYLELYNNDDNVQIVFKNISKEEMNFTEEEIEERFVRGDKSRHETGFGLGLAIVKSFTEIQHGTFKINIEGDLFKTTVTFKK